MSPRAPATLLALLATGWGACGAGALKLTRTAGEAAAEHSALSMEWRACLAAEAGERRFWASEWETAEADLLRLAAAAGAAPANGSAKASKSADHVSPLAGLHLNLSPKNPADLVPALAMLKSLYEQGKDRIGKLNAHEQDLKHSFSEKQVLHDKKVATIAARLKNHTLSKDLGDTESKQDTRLFAYWSRVRSLQHHQYHTSLKIQHATLMKVKQMMNMYEKTIAGKENKKQLVKEFSKVGGNLVPEVVLVQEEARRVVTQFCQAQLVKVRAARAELLQARA